MSAVTICILLADGILILCLLWLSINALYSQSRNLDALKSSPRLVNILRVLMVAPPVVVIIISILFFFVLHNEFFLRFAHAFFLLGMWMAITISMFSMLLFMRLKHTLQLSALLAFLGAIIPIVLFTSVLSFQHAFGQGGYIFPLLEGLAIIGASYPLLMRLSTITQRFRRSS